MHKIIVSCGSCQKNCYVDELMSSVDNIPKARDMCQQLTKLGKILKDIAEKVQASEIV